MNLVTWHFNFSCPKFWFWQLNSNFICHFFSNCKSNYKSTSPSAPSRLNHRQNYVLWFSSHLYSHILKKSLFRLFLNGGGGGIRTHGTRERTTVFKTAPINRSGTPPYDCSDVILFYIINFICQQKIYEFYFSTLFE